MEWMDSAMVTRLLSLSHIGTCADVSIFGLDTPQLADIFFSLAADMCCDVDAAGESGFVTV